MSMSRFVALALVLSGCAGRSETMRYTSTTIPPWILKEWSTAQDELLEFDNLEQDPRRFGPYEWNWIQLKEPFSITVSDARERMVLRGFTMWEAKQIIICCGDRETVRHEAFHAILWRMGDPRYALHYPDLKEEEELR